MSQGSQAVNTERFYSRVAGARFVFKDGHDCYFPNHYFETSDRLEIEELNALCRFGTNPLIFKSDGEVPQFGASPQAFQIQSSARTADDADAMFALSLAVAHAAENKQQLVYDALPDNVRAAATPALLERMNQLLALQIDPNAVPPAPVDNSAPDPDATTAALAALSQFNIDPPAPGSV